MFAIVEQPAVLEECTVSPGIGQRDHYKFETNLLLVMKLNGLARRIGSLLGRLIKLTYRCGEPLAHSLLYSGVTSRMRRAACVSLEATRLKAANILVVAAHPDDEVIGAGVLLRDAKRATVVVVSNGALEDTSYSRFGRNRARDVARARSLEIANAFKHLNRPVLEFGIPDQRIIYRVPEVSLRIQDTIEADNYDYVVTHAYEGGHPDHDATALAVHCACQLIQERSGASPPIIEMTSYWLEGEATVYDRFRYVNGAGEVLTFSLSEGDKLFKRSLFKCYPTQERILRRFPIEVERFRVAPVYNFLEAPQGDQLGYERWLDYPTPQAWRRAAARALLRLGLVSQ